MSADMHYSIHNYPQVLETYLKRIENLADETRKQDILGFHRHLVNAGIRTPTRIKHMQAL